MKKISERITRLTAKIKAARERNFTRFGRLKLALLAVFPVYLAFVTEAAHLSGFGELFRFIFQRPGVFVFNVLCVSAIFGAFILITRRAYVSTAICSVIFYIFTCSHFYKYGQNGQPFVIGDMMMTLNFGDLVRITTFYFAPSLFIAFFALLAYIAVLFMLNIKLNFKKRFSVAGGVCMLVSFLSVFAVKPVYDTVYGFFGVNTAKNINTFIQEEKFRENLLIAGVFESISKQFEYILLPPDDYSRAKVDEILSGGSPAAVNINNAELPDIIVVMSESFADMRNLSNVAVPDGAYSAFDRVTDRAAVTGTAIVPTFSNGTAKTEFEMLFGLPVKSLNNPFIPHLALNVDGVTEAAFPAAFGAAGYTTAYVHPFNSVFYSRERFYGEYGFDRMIFEDGFDVEIGTFYDYIDDETVFRQILHLLETAGDTPSCIYALTMQNHSPYVHEDFDGTEEEYFYAGIEKTLLALERFCDELSRRNRPAILLFIGDHFPFFGVENDVYGAAGYNADNCGELYEQTFVLYANYELPPDVSALFPDRAFSAFYLPHLLKTAALGANSEYAIFTAAMLEKMNTTPIYTDTYRFRERDLALDILTYDRTVGNRYSPG